MLDELHLRWVAIGCPVSDRGDEDSDIIPACTTPEQPPNDDTVYHVGCRVCLLALMANISLGLADPALLPLVRSEVYP